MHACTQAPNPAPGLTGSDPVCTLVHVAATPGCPGQSLLLVLQAEPHRSQQQQQQRHQLRRRPARRIPRRPARLPARPRRATSPLRPRGPAAGAPAPPAAGPRATAAWSGTRATASGRRVFTRAASSASWGTSRRRMRRRGRTTHRQASPWRRPVPVARPTSARPAARAGGPSPTPLLPPSLRLTHSHHPIKCLFGLTACACKVGGGAVAAGHLAQSARTCARGLTYKT